MPRPPSMGGWSNTTPSVLIRGSGWFHRSAGLSWLLLNLLKLLLPMTLPSTISDCPPSEAMVFTTNSGAEVPKPTITMPINSGGMPKWRAEGRPLDSAEYQAVEAWHALLSTFSALSDFAGPLTRGGALAMLGRLAGERPFQPQAGEIVHNIAPIIASLCDSGEGDETLCDPDACDGAPCGAHPTPPDDDTPPSTPGVVAGSASGCRVATGEAHPSLLMLLLVGWVAIRRVRQRAS